MHKLNIIRIILRSILRELNISEIWCTDTVFHILEAPASKPRHSSTISANTSRLWESPVSPTNNASGGRLVRQIRVDVHKGRFRDFGCLDFNYSLVDKNFIDIKFFL